MHKITCGSVMSSKPSEWGSELSDRFSTWFRPMTVFYSVWFTSSLKRTTPNDLFWNRHDVKIESIWGRLIWPNNVPTSLIRLLFYILMGGMFAFRTRVADIYIHQHQPKLGFLAGLSRFLKGLQRAGSINTQHTTAHARISPGTSCGALIKRLHLCWLHPSQYFKQTRVTKLHILLIHSRYVWDPI